MRKGFSITTVFMRQIGIAVRFDTIESAWTKAHCVSLLLPGVSFVILYNP